MKRITIILSLIAMMLGSAISYADDVNIFLRNRWDNQIDQSDGKKSQVLFLIDVIAEGEPVCETEYTCYAMNDDQSRGEVIDCDTVDDENNNDGDGSCGTGCFDATNPAHMVNKYFQMNTVFSPYINTNHTHFRGCFCPNNSDGNSEDQPGYYKVRECTQGGIDVRPVIQKVMQQRPDVKYGVMALNNNKTADLILPVQHRDEDPMDSASTVHSGLYADSFPTLAHPESSNSAVFPSLGGMQSVESYLKGDLAAHQSPLTDECKYTQLVVITNGGWKNDLEADPSGALTSLTQRIVENTVKPGCSAQVATSVIGINVPENNSADYPLFEDGDTSVASSMAANGQGIYENVKPKTGETDSVIINKQVGTGILNAVLGIIDFSYDQPTALITPVAPVSISRGHNLDVLYASSFKAQGDPKWPGNITKADSGSIPQSNFDSSSFSFPADRTSRQIKTICGEQLCDLDVGADFAAEDLAWLQGVGIAEDTDVLGDIVHFRPLPIHYGNVDSDLENISANEIYVVVGTNRGLLHIFDYNGNEQWAFLPPQLKPMVTALRQGNIAPAYNMVNHFYGVDGAPSIFIYDDDRDGVINDGGDRVLLYYGLRRGGAGYFAIDITIPTAASLLWQIGGSDLDYGTKPDAEITGGAKTEEEEMGTPRSGSSGACPVIRGDINASFNPSFVVEGASTLKGSGETLNHLNFRESSSKSFETIYFKGFENGTPYWTTQNQCVPNIDEETGQYDFDGHPAAMVLFTLQTNGNICYVGSGANDLIHSVDSMEMHMGLGTSSTIRATGMTDFESLVGFDLSGLNTFDDQITITDASITLGHTGYGTQSDAQAIYDSGVLVYAAHDGYFGQYHSPDSAGDCSDNTYYGGAPVAQISPPTGYSISLGSRTTGGSFKDYGLTDEQLTDIFVENRHDDSRGHSWVQFKIKRSDTSTNKVLYWGRPFEGPAIANFEGDNFWDKTVPRLTLKWCITGSDAEGGCDYTGSTDPELTIKQTGGFGSVTAQNLTNLAATLKECTVDECKYTYNENDSVKLTASITNFTSWSGNCASITGNICTVTMDEAKTVTANYSSTTPVLNIDLEGGSGKVSVWYQNGGPEYTSEYTVDESLPIDAGSSVKLTPDPVADFDSWMINGVSSSCDDTTKVCTFTMPSANVNAKATFNSGSATCSNSKSATNADHVTNSRATLSEDKNCSAADTDAECIAYGASAYYPYLGGYCRTALYSAHDCEDEDNSYISSGSGSWSGKPDESQTLYENENNNKWYTDQDTCKSAQ